MPYKGEVANKASFVDIIKSQEVKEFLEDCKYLKEPSKEELQEWIKVYKEAPEYDLEMPEFIMAVDGSNYEASINDNFPHTKLGYIKIGTILIDTRHFSSLGSSKNKFVDPFQIAKLEEANTPITIALPSANVHYKDMGSVRNGFGKAVDEHLYSIRIKKEDPNTSLRSMLFELAFYRTGSMSTETTKSLKLHRCPNENCKSHQLNMKESEKVIEIFDIIEDQFCPYCDTLVYPSDCLRIWEEISEVNSNQSPLTRLMLVVEHLISINYIRILKENLEALSQLTFFVDGPLAIFGPAAWLHAPIMKFIKEVNDKLEAYGFDKITIIGLQKTGAIVDYVNLISKHLQNNTYYLIEDEYRYKNIYSGRKEVEKGFGIETYYGQDFVYKTSNGRTFTFALPYPFESKLNKEKPFKVMKTDVSRYSDLAKALSIIKHFESDLYENAIIPIALAHKYTAISLSPGGKVLDLLTKQNINIH